MSIDEVKDKIRTLEEKGENTTALKMEVHNRYAFPFACIVFSFIGVFPYS
jgi:lipopolysaccharide export LptBFGC system permease protein LptF